MLCIGVSAGSINSFVIALFDIGKELEAADYLCDLYANIQRTDIFQDWPFGIIQVPINPIYIYINHRV